MANRVDIDLDKFTKVTGYDIRSFVSRYVAFYSNYYQSIVSFYNGSDTIDVVAFNEMDYLLKEASKIEPLFELHASRLDTIDYWEFLDLFSEMQTKLLSTKNTGKWLRSSRLNVNDTSVKVDRVQENKETIEAIARDLGYADPDNDWKLIAIDNQVIEEGYTMDGGTIFTVTFKNNANINLPNIVDYFSGKNILGKDIHQKIEFVDNDLRTVEYEAAMKQSFYIKINAKKNSIPEFPEFGIFEEIIGSNVAALSYPAIFRDVTALFKQDGRWKEASILDLYRKDDAVFMKMQAVSILNAPEITNINV